MFQLSGYQVNEQIYQSSKVAVYRGFSEELQRPVILKTLVGEYPSLVEIARFRHEHRLLNKLKCDGIQPSIEVVIEGKHIALVFIDHDEKALSEVIGNANKLDLPECL